VISAIVIATGTRCRLGPSLAHSITSPTLRMPPVVSLELNSAICGLARLHLRPARPLIWPLGGWIARLSATPFGVLPTPVLAGQHGITRNVL
jgi:hypothetical protein